MGSESALGISNLLLIKFGKVHSNFVKKKLFQIKGQPRGKIFIEIVCLFDKGLSGYRLHKSQNQPDILLVHQTQVLLYHQIYFCWLKDRSFPQTKTSSITLGIALVDDMRPFSTVNSSAIWYDIIHECEPLYSFPSRSIFSDKIIPRMYETVSVRVKDEIRCAESVAWTTDSRTSLTLQ